MHPHPLHASSANVKSLAFVAATVLVLTSCGLSDKTPVGVCAATAPLAVEITVRDSVSGQAAAEGAIGTLVGTGVDDTLRVDDSLTMRGGNKLGTYVVTIDRAGYLTWMKSNVHVTEVGACGNVIPVELNARLQPEMP